MAASESWAYSSGRLQGRGWALAGDADHHKDPIIARGIADAFRDLEAAPVRHPTQ